MPPRFNRKSQRPLRKPLKRSRRRAGSSLRRPKSRAIIWAPPPRTATHSTKSQRYVVRSVSGGLTATKAQTRALPRGFVTIYYLSHSITFTEHWKTAFKCDFLSRIAQEAAVRFAQESAFEDASCRFVGAPLPVEVYTDGRIAADSILKMAWSSIPVEHVLCAHVCDQTWLCHR